MNPSLILVFSQVKKNLSPAQLALVNDVEVLIKKLSATDHISDYSFLVSPISKAYEGYLKDFFFKLAIINEDEYSGDLFRVGKTLNPSLRYKRFSVFQKLTDIHDNGQEIAEIIWDAWKFGRNEIFHYFPKNLKSLSKSEAEDRIIKVLSAIIKSTQFLNLYLDSSANLL